MISMLKVLDMICNIFLQVAHVHVLFPFNVFFFFFSLLIFLTISGHLSERGKEKFGLDVGRLAVVVDIVAWARFRSFS